MSPRQPPWVGASISGGGRILEAGATHLSELELLGAQLVDALGSQLLHGRRGVENCIGLVLSERGGTLDKLLPIYRLGLGAPLGSGQQWMSWIHLDDVVRFVVQAASDPKVVGPHNLVAPEPVTNRAFSQALARALSRPHFAPAVPAFALKLAMGEMASLLLTSQHVVPENLDRLGFTWTVSRLDEALERCTRG